MKPIIVDFHHDLDPVEVRQRMEAGVAKLPAHIPGGMAQVHSRWLDAHQMQVDVQTMGQDIATILEVENHNVRVTVQLPLMLGLLRGPIEAMIRHSGQKLLLAAPGAQAD